MNKITIPTWQECDERINNFKRTDRTVLAASFHGIKLNPLEKMVHSYDDSNYDLSHQFMNDLKNLVEWCVNHPDQVLAQHEQL